MIDILNYTFFQNALWAILLISITSAIIGTYIVARRMLFITGGITHASFGGLGVGYYLGINPTLSALVFAILSYRESEQKYEAHSECFSSLYHSYFLFPFLSLSLSILLCRLIHQESSFFCDFFELSVFIGIPSP